MQIQVNTLQPFHLAMLGRKGSIVNLDTSGNSIFVGPQAGMISGDPDNYILGPLNSGYHDGSREAWVQAITGTPQVAFMEGLVNWQPSPAQVQALLISSGIPLIAAPKQLLASASITIAANASNQVIFGPSDITAFLSYEIEFTATASVGVIPNNYIDFFVQWMDSTGTFVLYEEKWTVPALGSGAHVVGTGPCYGSQLQILASSHDPANAMTLTGLRLYGSSRPTQRNSDWRTGPCTSSQNGLDPLTGSSLGLDYMLGTAPAGGITIAAGTNRQWLFGTYNGDVQFTLKSSGITTNSLTFNFQAPTLGTSAFYTVTQDVTIGAAGNVVATLTTFAPRAPLIVTATNNAGVSDQVYITAIGLPHT